MKTVCRSLCSLIGFTIGCLAVNASAATVTLSPTSQGFQGGTLVLSANLTGLGLSQVGSITLQDDGTTTGGESGIFSGFDLDAVFLDADGDLETSDDRVLPTDFIFTAGSTRPTSNSNLLPTAAHPGPTFGSLDPSTIDLPTATLDEFDGTAVADVDVADGFLTLGDGGVLVANFAPEVTIGDTLFLLLGEVGGQPGEELGATIEVSEEPGRPGVPEPLTIVLLGSGLLGLAAAARKRSTRP